MSLATERTPVADVLFEERAWFSDERKNVISALVWDLTDKDWSYVILKRDEQGKFRPVEFNVSYSERGEAQTQMLKEMRLILDRSKN